MDIFCGLNKREHDRLALCIQHSLSKLSASEDFNRAATADIDCDECSRGIDREQDSGSPAEIGWL